MTEILTSVEKTAMKGILRELDPTAKGLPKELRRWKRHGVLDWMRIQYRCPELGGRLRLDRILVRDVSAGGVGFYSKRNFIQGERFALPIRFGEGGGRLYWCEVTFTKSVSDRHYAIGARFIDYVDDPEGQAVVPGEWA